MDFTVEMALVMGISAVALGLFVFEVVAPDIVALLAVLAVVALGLVEPEVALSGFANPAVHTIASMFIISAGLLRTGVVESFGRWLIERGGDRPGVVYSLTLATVVVLSAFINNTPIVVMMIPVALSVSRVHGFPASKFLIPISYASIFGGTCTLIGTSTNLVVSGMAADAGLEPFSMFEMAPVGVIMAVLGVGWLATVGRRILPYREAVTSHVTRESIREFVTELVVPAGSTLVGRRLATEIFRPERTLCVLQLIRGETIHWPPFLDLHVAEGDILIVRGPADDILAASRAHGLRIVPDLSADVDDLHAATHTLAELVVTPGSRFEGAPIREIGFRQHFGVKALAVERHGRHQERAQVLDTPLKVGDIILVRGGAREVDQLKDEEGVILLEGVERTVVHRHRAPIALAITAGVIVTATFTPVPVVACALGGALLMVLTGCLSVRQIYRNLDVHTLVLIAGMIGLGHAAADTGAAAWVAHHAVDVIRPLGPIGVLAVLYLLTNVVTEFLSNAAAAVLTAPLAIETAHELGVSERPFLIAVAFAASAAFSTPVGYQTNTIVYGPGGYRFGDFTRAGLPLNLAFWVVATLLIPVFWPF